jgi:aflatoxin B1 aldehyde reductase
MSRTHDLKDCEKILDVFQSHGHREVDTALFYGDGTSEEYLGDLNWQKRGLIMETKLYPGPFKGAKITHTKADLRKYLLDQLKALKADKVNLWYLHGPDRTTPYEETMKAINELHKEGLFDRFGISNFMSWEVAQINEICIKNGWIRPSVFQGVYNAIHRSVEAELFPCLRHYKMSFYAFNPLAGGYLTSRYHREDIVEGGDGSRFDPKTRQGTQYRTRYWNDVMFTALDIVREAASTKNLTESECALRWLMHHSKLSAQLGDAVIVGASSLKHLEDNLQDMEKGPLPESVLHSLDQAWHVAKGSAWNYFH